MSNFTDLSLKNSMGAKWSQHKIQILQARIHEPLSSLQIRVCNQKLILLFLNQNICCGYSKEPFQ